MTARSGKKGQRERVGGQNKRNENGKKQDKADTSYEEKIDKNKLMQVDKKQEKRQHSAEEKENAQKRRNVGPLDKWIRKET